MAPPPLRRSGATQVPAHAVTEDTPADMLTGQMSLSVLLPDGRHCRMNVDRGTPMMDLLIQVATANKISPGGHVIQVISDRSHSCLSYKPSTPIGTLDTTALRIVEKNKINELPSRRVRPPPQNPLADAKIRIKVYLPRNQLSAMRVSPKTPLAEVLDQICKDKNLDVTRYELRHPVNVDERLRPSCCLADYKLQEVTVVPLNSRTNTVLSSADIIAMQKKSDGKRKIFAIFGKKSKPSVIESTASSDSLGERSVSPDGSDESAERPRSLSPQPAQVIQAPPRAKKRAAPKPPQVNGGAGVGGPPSAAPAPPPPPVAARPPSELSEGAESVESRHSSDSSGYHEAGLSDAPDSPTERAPAPPAPPSNLGSVSSYSTSNLMSSSNLTQVNSTSTVSLSSAIRKRRAPPPPAIPRIAEDPQPASAPAPPRQAPTPAAAPAATPAAAPAAAPAPAAAAPVASSPVVQQQSQQTQQSELAAPCSEGGPAASAAAAAEGRVAPQPLRRSSLGARRPQPLPRLLPAGQPAAGADHVVVPPPPGFDDPEPAGAVAAVRLREGLARSGQPRPASVGSRPSTLQRKKRAPPPPGPPPLASATSLPATRSPRESPDVIRATSAGDPRAPTPVSRCASSQMTGSVDLTDVTSLDSFRSWSSDSEPSRSAPVVASRGQTLRQFSGESDEDGSSGGDGNSECAVRPREGVSEAAARPHVIHRWRNSTNLDQLVADARGHTQEEEAGGRSAGSSASSPERTRLAAPLRQDSGTSSTETLTAESAAGSDPAPAPSPAPSAGEEKVDSARTETTEKRQTSGHSASVERSVDHPRPTPRAEAEPVQESRGSSPTVSEEEPTPAEAVEEDAVSSTVSEESAVVPPAEPERPATTVTPVAPAAPASLKSPVEKPAMKPPAPEVLPKTVMRPEPASELPAMAAEPAPVTNPVETPKQTATVEESVLEKVAPTPVAMKTRAPQSPVAAPAPAVIETSAPVVLEAPAAVVPTPPSPPPAPAATLAEALPTASRQKAPPAAPPADSGSDLSSSETPSGAVEPSEQSGIEEEDDSDTAQLQREVDSALACLDNNLDEALAETAAFTESSSLQTQSRLPPAPAPTAAAAEVAAVEAAVETLPAVVREPVRAPRQTPVVTPVEALFAVPSSRQTVRERETVEVIDTLLPVARVAPPPAPVETPKAPPVASAGSQEVAEEVATVVTESRPRTAQPAAETAREVTTPRPATIETESSPKPTAVEEPLVEAVVARRRTPKLGAANRQRPVEVQEEVVERVEKAQRKRMTSKDIKLHIERKLASFDVPPPRSARQKSQLVTPPVSAPVGAESPDWQYRLPAPPTPFQDGVRTGPPLEAPLEFQDNMTVTSSEPSEVGELAEATNGPLLERVSQSDSTPAIGDQSEPALENGGESEPAPASVDQWDGGRPERPAKPARRPSSERLSRQMSFSIGAYGQREAAAGADGSVTSSRPQRADSFHCQKSSSTSAVTEQVTSASAAAGTEMSAPRRPVSRRRSSDASRVQRSAEAAEPIRPPRKYELKFNSSKSYSMLNLSNGALTTPTESPSPNMNKTQSQTDLAIESEVSDIQSEFLKLQRQFLHWQQQLLQNQSILQTKVAPLAARPAAAASLQSLEVRRGSEPQPPPPPPVCLEGLARRRPSAGVESARRRRQAPVPPAQPPSPPPEMRLHSRSTSPLPPPPPVATVEEPRAPSPESPVECSTSSTPVVLQSTPSHSVSASLSGAAVFSNSSPVRSTSMTVSLEPSSTPGPLTDRSTPTLAPFVQRSTLPHVSSAPVFSATPSARTGRRRTPPPVPPKESAQQIAARRRQVIEELRSRVPEQNPAPEEQETPVDYAGRSQSLPRGTGLQNSKLSVAERRRGEREPDREREREPQREPERHRQRERSPPSGGRQRASTLERRPETPPQSEPESARQRASTLERRPSETREKRVPWSPPKVALGTWADQSRQSQVQLKEDRDYVLRQAPAPAPVQQQQSTDAEPESSARRPTAVSVRPSKSVTVTSLGAPPPPVAAPEPSPPQSGALSAVAKVRHNETVPAPTSVLVSAPSARVSSARQPPAFSISDSKPSHAGRGGVTAAAGRFTSVVSLTDEPRQPHTVSVQVSKPIARTSRTSETATVTCRVSPADQAPSQSPPQQQTQRTVPSVVSVTRKDSATSTELAARQAGSEAARRTRNQPVVKGFRQSEVPAPVPPPPPPPPAPVMPAAAEAAAGRARLRPVSSGRQVVPKLDPREELMIAIREHGGLKKRGGVRP